MLFQLLREILQYFEHENEKMKPFLARKENKNNHPMLFALILEQNNKIVNLTERLKNLLSEKGE